jgi:hypothetical protein
VLRDQLGRQIVVEVFQTHGEAHARRKGVVRTQESGNSG